MRRAAASNFERQMAKMRRRYPTIAEAADHPLTEALIGHGGPGVLKSLKGLIPHVPLLPAALGLWMALFTSFRLSGLVMSVLVLVAASVFLKPIDRRLRLLALGQAGGFAGILARRDARLLELWLTPLTFRDMMGIEAGRISCRPFRAAKRWAFFVLLGAFLAAFFWFSRGWSWAPQGPLTAVLFSAAVFSFFLPGIWAADDSYIQASCETLFEAVREGAKDLEPRRFRFGRFSMEGFVSLQALVFLTICGELAAFLALALWAGEENWIWMLGGIGFLLGAWTRAVTSLGESDLNAPEFRELAVEGQFLYEELVRKVAEKI